MDTKTDFKQHTKQQLLTICEEFALDINPQATKEEIIARIAEDGIDYSFYKSLHPDVDENTPTAAVVDRGEVKILPVVPSAEPVLLKMTRPNATFEVRGYRFTRNIPYALVKEEDVDYLIEEVGGFEVARRSEVEKFFG
jgi:hypothetical protein